MSAATGRGPALALILLAAAALVIGSGIGYFRAEDWLGLEIGALAFSHWRDILLTMWHDDFYRPVTDFYVGVMVHLSPRELQDAFMVIDSLHYLRRPVAAFFRGAIGLADENEALAMRGRFNEIWAASFPAVSSTTVGL